MGVAALRRRIRELERSLQGMAQQQESLRRQMEEHNEARLREMRQAMAQADAAQVQRVRAMQEALSQELHRQIEELRRADAAAQAQRQALLDQIAQVNRELQAELEDLRRQERQRTETGRQAAEQLCQAAQERVRAVEETPHAFFCPGQLEVFREHLESARTMLRAEMYDAAAAAADAAAAELELLQINVRERQREWMEMFQVYETLANTLKQTLEQFEAEPVTTVFGAFRLTDPERSYWSREGYPAVRREVLEAWELVRGVREAESLTAYLNSGKGLQGFQLTRQINGLHRLSERLTAVMLCIRGERAYSDQRYAMAQNAGEALEAAGYRIVEEGFQGEPEEPLDCYVLTAAMGGDRATLTFAPRREDGVAVGNVCIVTLDARVVPNPQLIQARAQEVLTLAAGSDPSLRTEWYPEGDVRREAAQKAYVREPDMNALARRLERKYQ